MLLGRRTFLTGISAMAGWQARSAAVTAPGRAAGAVTAIAFDAFPIIDSRPLAAHAETMFPGMGSALIKEWRTRQFEYTWLRTLGGAYVDFWQVTRESLEFAATSLGIPLEVAGRDALMQSYLELRAWEDARPALEVLKRAGIRMAFLSNFTAAMLDAVIENSGLHGLFEEHLSTDRVRAFKPDRRAYAMGSKAFGAPRAGIVFCAAAGWDVAGAKWYGYRTFWLNRSGQPAESLGVRADGVGTGMQDLVKFVQR